VHDAAWPACACRRSRSPEPHHPAGNGTARTFLGDDAYALHCDMFASHCRSSEVDICAASVKIAIDRPSGRPLMSSPLRQHFPPRRHGRACPGHPRPWSRQHVDARHKAGHDERPSVANHIFPIPMRQRNCTVTVIQSGKHILHRVLLSLTPRDIGSPVSHSGSIAKC
jgi:hypothetical protein